MTIAEEYQNQSNWRNWESYLAYLPIRPEDTILDLGCGTGVVTQLLAQRASQVIGIDINADLIHAAKTMNHSSNIEYLTADLKQLTNENLPLVDGIWTSFTVAYFPEFAPILENWLKLLKPNGWIAIVEMSDLFGHAPVSPETRAKFKSYYERQRSRHLYDFEMGRKVKDFVVDKGLKIQLEQTKSDRELSFMGPADKDIVTAWENRLNRMVALQDFLGSDVFPAIKAEFLACLTHENHTSTTEVKFIIARK